jgi:hypothetical protein
MIKEDAPTVNAGSGNVAGIGVGAKGEPGVQPKDQPKGNRSIPTKTILAYLRRKAPNPLAEETFAGAMVFEVSSSLFHNLTLQKRKGKHWRTYLEEDDCYAEIREWAKKHPKGKIVVRNECTGEMRYVRY